MAPTKERPATKSIATNREARHEYFVLEALETGVELKGTEVKSLRAGGVNLKDSWVDIENGELLVKGMHISPYDHGNLFNQDPMRVRRLLAHKSEIRRLHYGHPDGSGLCRYAHKAGGAVRGLYAYGYRGGVAHGKAAGAAAQPQMVGLLR